MTETKDQLHLKLYEAVLAEDTCGAKELLACGAAPSVNTDDGVSPLHLVAGPVLNDSTDSEELIKLMLQYGGDPNVRSSEGTTPLHIAAAHGRCKQVKILLKYGANPFLLDQDGMTAFENATQSECDICTHILENHRQKMDFKPCLQIQQNPPPSAYSTNSSQRIPVIVEDYNAPSNLKSCLKRHTFQGVLVDEDSPHSVQRKSMERQSCETSGKYFAPVDSSASNSPTDDIPNKCVTSEANSFSKTPDIRVESPAEEISLEKEVVKIDTVNTETNNESLLLYTNHPEIFSPNSKKSQSHQAQTNHILDWLNESPTPRALKNKRPQDKSPVRRNVYSPSNAQMLSPAKQKQHRQGDNVNKKTLNNAPWNSPLKSKENGAKYVSNRVKSTDVHGSPRKTNPPVKSSSSVPYINKMASKDYEPRNMSPKRTFTPSQKAPYSPVPCRVQSESKATLSPRKPWDCNVQVSSPKTAARKKLFPGTYATSLSPSLVPKLSEDANIRSRETTATSTRKHLGIANNSPKHSKTTDTFQSKGDHIPTPLAPHDIRHVCWCTEHVPTSHGDHMSNNKCGHHHPPQCKVSVNPPMKSSHKVRADRTPVSSPTKQKWKTCLARRGETCLVFDCECKKAREEDFGDEKDGKYEDTAGNGWDKPYKKKRYTMQINNQLECFDMTRHIFDVTSPDHPIIVPRQGVTSPIVEVSSPVHTNTQHIVIHHIYNSPTSGNVLHNMNRENMAPSPEKELFQSMSQRSTNNSDKMPLSERNVYIRNDDSNSVDSLEPFLPKGDLTLSDKDKASNLDDTSFLLEQLALEEGLKYKPESKKIAKSCASKTKSNNDDKKSAISNKSSQHGEGKKSRVADDNRECDRGNPRDGAEDLLTDDESFLNHEEAFKNESRYAVRTNNQLKVTGKHPGDSGFNSSTSTENKNKARLVEIGTRTRDVADVRQTRFECNVPTRQTKYQETADDGPLTSSVAYHDSHYWLDGGLDLDFSVSAIVADESCHLAQIIEADETIKRGKINFQLGDKTEHGKVNADEKMRASRMHKRVVLQDETADSGGSGCSCKSAATIHTVYTDNDEGYSLLEVHIPPVANVHPDCSIHSQKANVAFNNSQLSGDTTILYDWKEASRDSAGLDDTTLSQSILEVDIPQKVQEYTNAQLREKLTKYGDVPGPIAASTRSLYEKKLVLLKRFPHMVRAVKEKQEFQEELARAFDGDLDISGLESLYGAMSAPFRNANPKHQWREGVLKGSFNYLLLDPRVTNNLPSRAKDLGEQEGFKVFVKAIFYVGKGKRSRPYMHFKEAIKEVANPSVQPGCKVKHILDIWGNNMGAISLHVFQNIIPVEAYTREACMIEALGLKRLTNQKAGDNYGPAAIWPAGKRKLLGVFLLRKAYRIFVEEGERQIKPHDVK